MTTDNAPEIKVSRHPDVQKRVDEQVSKINSNYPEAPINAVTAQARDKVASEITRERLRKELGKDPLTGLLSLRGYKLRENEEMERARRYNRPMAVGILDLDELKATNDSKGHDAGDKLLIDTANILREVSRHTDVLARVGGDEYKIILTETNPEQAKIWLERLRNLLQAKQIKASIGLVDVDLTKKIEHSRERADAEMYKEKRGKKNGNGNGDYKKQPSFVSKVRNFFKK